ncbi:hypothetical protein YC2023_061340 [Brassica napus]|uniref:Peptidase M16 C-terminal domain-containing protein n=1 Tax=Brassica oleracea TaxID=3712 RepID=A0A3P6FM32_BRAOL|nr:unnamed protein product [Brassica oleracea]
MYRTAASRAKALKGVFQPPPLPGHVEPSKLKITALPNGLKIASHMSPLRKMKVEIAELAKNPMGLLMEAVHTAAYSGALANPLYAHESALDRLNGELLEEFMTENFTVARMVLAASGVEHEELLQVAEPLTSDLPNVPRQVEPKSQYTGGDFLQHTGGDFLQHTGGELFFGHLQATHFALAFEVPGWNNEKEAVIATVLQMLMGGGGSFSAGGPGKGMHSWLCKSNLVCVTYGFIELLFFCYFLN